MSFDTLNGHLDFIENQMATLFIGEVVDNKDPEGLDRIKATVPGLYEVQGTDLPWILPNKASSFGCGSTWGTHGAPALGSKVLVQLQEGDPHYPIYTSIKSGGDSEFPSGASWGFKDPKGNKLIVNLESDTILFSASSGVEFKIEGGNLTVTTQGSTTLNSKNAVLNVDDSLKVNAATTNIKSQVTIDGPLTVTGKTTTSDIATTGSLTNNGKDVGSGHVHMGVRSGTNNSGTPI